VNTKLVNSAAGVIFAAQKNGYTTATGWAAALDSAQMLQSPESAAELDALRARVAELEAERHITNEALSEAAEALRANRDRIAGLEQRIEAESLSFLERAARETSPARRQAWRMLAAAEASAQNLKALLEDPHDSPLHHDYRLGRDLPEVGSAS
jgi:chromosome segregation ATPase